MNKHKYMQVRLPQKKNSQKRQAFSCKNMQIRQLWLDKKWLELKIKYLFNEGQISRNESHLNFKSSKHFVIERLTLILNYVFQNLLDPQEHAM